MSGKLTRSAYEQLLTEDIAWLVNNTEDTLERGHIIAVLMDSPMRLYEDDINNETYRGIPQSRINQISMFDKMQMACPLTACITHHGESKCICKLKIEEER